MSLAYQQLLTAAAQFVDNYNEKERKDTEVASLMWDKSAGTAYVVYRNVCDDDDLYGAQQATLVDGKLHLDAVDALPEGVEDLGGAYRKMYFEEFSEVCRQQGVDRGWLWQHRQACLNGLLAAMTAEDRRRSLSYTYADIKEAKKSLGWAWSREELHKVIRYQIRTLAGYKG